jgi:hypothetical protein
MRPPSMVGICPTSPRICPTSTCTVIPPFGSRGRRRAAPRKERSRRARLLLEPARPNPFFAATELVFSLPEAGPAFLEVHDAGGRRVATLLDRWLGAGRYSIRWSGLQGGASLPNGIYFITLRAGAQRLGQTAVTLLRP